MLEPVVQDCDCMNLWQSSVGVQQADGIDHSRHSSPFPEAPERMSQQTLSCSCPARKHDYSMPKYRTVVLWQDGSAMSKMSQSEAIVSIQCLCPISASSKEELLGWVSVESQCFLDESIMPIIGVELCRRSVHACRSTHVSCQQDGAFAWKLYNELCNMIWPFVSIGHLMTGRHYFPKFQSYLCLKIAIHGSTLHESFKKEKESPTFMSIEPVTMTTTPCWEEYWLSTLQMSVLPSSKPISATFWRMSCG